MTTELCGVASAAIAPLVTGKQRPARLAGLVRGALYLDIAGSADVIALVASDATRLPNAVVLPVRAAGNLFRAVNPCCPVTLGDGRASAGGPRITIAGTWDPRPAIRPPTGPFWPAGSVPCAGLIIGAPAGGIAFPLRLLDACVHQFRI